MSPPAVTLLRPILDLYKDSPVALVGCHSKGIARRSCELDVVVVSDEKSPPTSVKMGGAYVDLVFTTEKEALRTADPEHAVSLAHMKPIRDSSLLLTTSSATNSALLSDFSEKASARRLASAVKTLGRSDEALTRGALQEADFWLGAASFEFAYAWAFSREELPSPSHLLRQLKALSKGNPKYFEAFSAGAGLGRATRAGCGSRLEGLSVLHDVIKSGISRRGAGHSAWSDARLEIVTGKAKELAGEMELAECYSYMGQEIVDYVQAMISKGSRVSPSVASLMSSKNRLLSERLLRQLGLSRQRQAIAQGLEGLREAVYSLTRNA